MFSGLPPKADLLILELLPPPAFRERRHRGLARRRVDELERLLDRYRALTLAIETGVPPAPAPRVN